MYSIKLFAGWMILIFTAGMAFGQGGTGQVSGTVTDPNGAVIRGAAVKVTNVGTNFARETTTNSDGVFTVALLPAGKYSVKVTSTGFQAYNATAPVNITQTTTLDIQLAIKGDQVSVVVEGSAAQTETSQNGRTVTGETIRQLPLPSRNFQQLLALSPGAQSSVSNSTDL